MCGAVGTGVTALLSPQLVYPHDFRLTEKEVSTPQSRFSLLWTSSGGLTGSWFLCRKRASATCPSQTPTQVGDPGGDRSVPGGRTIPGVQQGLQGAPWG